MSDPHLPNLFDESSSPARSPEHNFFRRPGFAFAFVRVCIFIFGAVILTFGLVTAAQRLFLTSDFSAFTPRSLFIFESTALAGILIPALLMAHLEGRNFGDYGLPATFAFGKHFWLGALFGMTEISVVIAASAAFGAYHFGALAIHGAAIARWLLFWAVLFLIVGLYEEFAFRGYALFTLAQGVRFWPAAIFLSLAFGAVHLRNPGENWVGIGGVVLVGFFWCFTVRRTGTLWFAVGMHAAFDFGETFLYSVPDSGMIFPGHLSNATLAGARWLTGGSAGPEASVLDFAMLLVFFYVFHRLYPPSRESSLAAR